MFIPAGEQMDYSTYLGEKEKVWAQERLKEAKAKNYRTIVLTHHQLVSAFWKKKFKSARLVEQLAEVFLSFFSCFVFCFPFDICPPLFSIFPLLSSYRFLFFIIKFTKVDNNIVSWMWGHEHRLVVFDTVHIKSSKGKSTHLLINLF